ncbi:MAG: hypothetical protein IJM76_10310 [Lachnospiraceae bacterium]|nr:hypothetical protein [Lachnospiraceae bacterium]
MNHRYLYILVICLVIIVTICGCGNMNESSEKSNIYDGNICEHVHISDFEIIKKGNEIRGFNLSLENDSDYTYTYGEWNRLEVLQKDTWYIFRSDEAKNFQFHLVAYSLEAGGKQSREYSYNYQKTLPKGHYRFVLSLVPGSHGIEQYVYNEFDIN